MKLSVNGPISKFEFAGCKPIFGKEHVMDEQGWQPVRIARIDESEYIDEDGCPWPAGKIVRVRIVPGAFCDEGGRGFEVHPEDDWGRDSSRQFLICEHQILAD